MRKDSVIEATPQERLIACVNHISGIFVPLLGPLAFLAIWGTRSPFIRAHVIAALLDAITRKLFLIVAFVVSLTVTLVRLNERIQAGESLVSREALIEMGVKLVVVWIVLGLVALYDLVKTLLQARSAYTGALPRGMARRLANRLAPIGILPSVGPRSGDV